MVTLLRRFSMTKKRAQCMTSRRHRVFTSSDIRESAATTTPTGMIGVISLCYMFRCSCHSVEDKLNK